MAITSLFGPSPAEIILAQQKEADQEQLLRNQMIAQQGAEFGPFRGLYQAGLRFGDIGAQAMRQGLFPQQADPRLQEATAIQSVLAKYADQDQTDPNILAKIGRDLMPIAPNAGIKAMALAKQLQPESPFAKIDPSKFTPESVAAFERSGRRSDLLPLEQVGKKVGVTENTNEIIYSDGKRQYIIRDGVEVPYTGGVREGAGTKIDLNLGQVLNEVFTRTEAKDKAEAWTKAGQVYRDNASLLATIDEFKRRAPNAFTGRGATIGLEASKVLSALGVPISDKAPNTELIRAFQSQFVQKIAKNFPGSQAIKELEQLILSQPNFTQELPTIVRLLDRFKDERLADQITYKQMSKLSREERANTDSNILSVDNFNKIMQLRQIEVKVANRTASKEEAELALSIKKELGI